MKIRIIVLSFLITLFTGCAVIRVDVDVYKGPLADERHVQVQRMAVMATGAKPLLIHSRDALLKDKVIKELIKRGAYEEEHIGILTSDFLIDQGYSASDWHSKSAQLINTTLSLYEDIETDNGPLSDLINKGRLALNSFYVARKSYAKNQKELGELLKKIDKDKFGDAKKERYLFYSFLSAENLSEQIADKQEKFFEKFETSTICNVDGPNEENKENKENKKEKSDYLRIDSVYWCLNDQPKVLKEDAGSFFTSEKKQKKFNSLLQKMADDYQAMWGALQNILRYTLMGLVVQDKDRSPSSPNSASQREAAIELIATLVQWGDARMALTNSCRIASDCAMKRIQINDEKRGEELKKQVKQLIYQDPAGAAAILLSTDAYLSDDKTSMFEHCEEECQNLPLLTKYKRGSRPFGLIFIPKNNNGGLERFNNIVSIVTNELNKKFQNFAGQALGLAHGRLETGLESMIKSYLEAADQDPNSVSTITKREKLTDALIRFAQKLLFIAQNRVYLEENTHKHTGSLGKDYYRNLFDIIEVVGNSILVQANELHARKIHNKKIEDQYDVYKKAIDQKFVRSLDDHIKSILDAIDAEKTQLIQQNQKLQTLIQKKKTDAQLVALKKAVNDAEDALEKAREEIPAGYHKFKTAHALLSDGEIKKCSDKSKKSSGCLQKDQLVVYKSCLEKVYTNAINNWDEAEEKPKKLKTLITIFDEYQAQEVKEKNCKNTPILTFEQYVTTQYGDIRIEYGEKLENIPLLEKVLESAEKAEEKAKEENQDVDKQIVEFKAKHPQLEKQLKFYTSDAIKLIKQVASDLLLKNIPTGNAYGILPMLKNSIASSSDAQKDNALKILEETKEPLVIPQSLFSDSNHSPTNPGCQTDDEKTKCPAKATALDAMDTLITWLEANHIRLVHDQGPNSKSVRFAEAAMKEAYRSRAGLTYLRPTSSYLRSSYTSSGLQPNQNLGWDNMLNDSLQRTIPVFDEFLQNQNFDRALNEIDKQFWQNINTVRVSGGGRSNYVLVKDDVGNWSVRGFTTNYDQTVASLRNIALFNYGEKLGTQLVGSDGEIIRADKAVKIDEGSGGLPGLFAEYREDFKKTRNSSYETIAGKLTNPGLVQQIETKWEENKKIKEAEKFGEIKNLAKEQYENILKVNVEKLSNEENKKNADLIYNLLRGLRKFNKNMAAQIEPKLLEGITGSEEEAKKAVTAAVSVVKTLIDTLIKDISDDRQKSIDKYQQALTFIGEAANRDSKPKNENGKLEETP